MNAGQTTRSKTSHFPPDSSLVIDLFVVLVWYFISLFQCVCMLVYIYTLHIHYIHSGIYTYALYTFKINLHDKTEQTR
jgi:hypothetical protein